MAYCHEKAIPHSEFMEWDPEDRSKLVAYILEQSERCQMCGTANWEWDENKYAYSAVDEFCHGCYQKSVFSDTMSTSLPGTNVRLIPTTPALRAKQQVLEKKRRKTFAEE